ncbi:MAG: alpha/beta fold hydrolase [Deltaproteobacteria bacterium]|nr:alpha/beta fold hydrolase [Deltaproteobacteria bacterium]
MPILRAGDTSLHFVDRGQGPRVVVLLHAFPLHAGMWARQIATLSAHHRVIAPDARGFGESREVSEALTPAMIAADALALLGELGIDRAIVCGLSMGGYAALELYRQAPSLVQGLVLADTRAAAETTPEGRANREKLAREVLEKGIDWIAGEVTPKLVAPDASLQVVAEVRRLIGENTPQGLAAAQRGMALRADSRELLGQIACPTLVLVGSVDALTPPSEAESMASAIPQSRLVVLEGAGHLSNLEAPEAFDAALLRFIGELD